MCDCPHVECDAIGCDNEIAIHIGDYSCPEDEVRAWCPDCLMAGSAAVMTKLQDGNCEYFAAWIEVYKGYGDQHEYMVEGGRYFFMCTSEDGYGIHLN